jgi:hypothetical protein
LHKYKALAFVYCILIISPSALAQNHAEFIQDSLFEKSIRTAGVKSQTKSVSGFLKEIQTYDRKGNIITKVYASGRAFGKITYGYDSISRMILLKHYLLSDTTTVQFWETMEYDSISAEERIYYHDLGSAKRLIILNVSKKGNECISQEDYRIHKNGDTTKTITRTCRMPGNMLLIDHIYYERGDSIQSISTYYKLFDDQARMIEYGNYYYTASIAQYLLNNPKMYLSMYTGSSKAFEMILDRKFEGEMKKQYSYIYDASGNINVAITPLDSLTYSYNSGGLVKQSVSYSYEGTRTTVYQYNDKGLLIRRQTTDGVGKTISLDEYTYEYY